MKNKKIFITDTEWFENGMFKNPIISPDNEMEKYFPDFYSLNFTTKILATNPPTAEEKQAVIYNDYRDKYGTSDLSSLDAEILRTGAKSIFLNGFNQQLFEYIASLIKGNTEVIYFFKCPKISDLSLLSQFSKLKCVQIFHNSSLTKLWDMSKNTELKVISFNMVSNLMDIESLKDSFVEYVHIDSIDNNGHKKPILFNVPSFEEMPHLKYFSVNFKNCSLAQSRTKEIWK